MTILPDGSRSYVECKHCPGTQLDPKHLFSYPSIVRALFKIDNDCSMDILYSDRAMDVATAVIWRVARQLGRSDGVVRRCWGQWIREMSFTRRPGSGHPRQTSCREDCHIVKNARVQPTASSAAIQAQVVPSLGPPVSSRTIRRRLVEGHLGLRGPLRVLLPIDASVWSGAAHEETGLQRNGSRSSLVANSDSISVVMTIVFVCGDPVVDASILPLLYSDTPLPQLVWIAIAYNARSPLVLIRGTTHDSAAVCP
ncbi:HTH_Tnp_Tc3_2 domain-containing protein [Trichonephila clavipes]|nr:HTH_Tnp_Tc3_2 domain-containing protein [Trichonephila clavipes]